MRSERTSKKVATIAGSMASVVISWLGPNGRCREVTLRGKELNAVCASALTQAADKRMAKAMTDAMGPRLATSSFYRKRRARRK